MALITHRYPVRSEKLREFSFLAAEHVPQSVLSWLAEWLTERIEGGTEFADGHTVQFGFWALRCRIDQGQLSLEAPNFVGKQLTWQPDLTEALRSIMVHKYMPDSFAAEISIPNMSSTVTVGQRFNEFPMLINRLEPIDNDLDSGWAFGHTIDDVDNNDPEQLSVMPLWEALEMAPWVHDYLSLPPGMQVFFESEPESAKVLRDFEPTAATPGSFFESLQRG